MEYCCGAELGTCIKHEETGQKVSPTPIISFLIIRMVSKYEVAVTLQFMKKRGKRYPSVTIFVILHLPAVVTVERKRLPLLFLEYSTKTIVRCIPIPSSEIVRHFQRRLNEHIGSFINSPRRE